jgi:hypothetical protein
MPPSKSSKQRATELKARRKVRAVKRAKTEAEDERARRVAYLDGLDETSRVRSDRVRVIVGALAPDGSYDAPSFVERGYYLDQPFTCVDCGKAEVWTATQQKWWYEVAKGGRWTTAQRCRPCRRRAREAKAEQTRKTEEGRARKEKLKAEGKWRRGF